MVSHTFATITFLSIFLYPLFAHHNIPVSEAYITQILILQIKKILGSFHGFLKVTQQVEWQMGSSLDFWMPSSKDALSGHVSVAKDPGDHLASIPQIQLAVPNTSQEWINGKKSFILH